MDFAFPAILDDVDAFVAAAPSATDLCDLLAALSPQSVTRPGGLYAEMQLPAAALQVGPRIYSPLDTRSVNERSPCVSHPVRASDMRLC